uniref:MD-2-related lipid-recognition domain-containing protein n=1 Tax=Glossina palpalis gambiensis TaxID=67801 RepID=A0A1B0ATE2_9MUSC
MLLKAFLNEKYFFWWLLFAITEVRGEAAFSIELNSFEVNKNYDTTWIDWNTMRMKKVARNDYVFTGDFAINRNLGNEQKISLMIFNYYGEQRKKGMIVYAVEKNFCTFLKDEEDIYTPIVQASNLPAEYTCPFPKGNYTVDNYSLNLDFLPPETPKGQYMIEASLKNGMMAVSRIDIAVTIS